jgi:hypothetical protein
VTVLGTAAGKFGPDCWLSTAGGKSVGDSSALAGFAAANIVVAIKVKESESAFAIDILNFISFSASKGLKLSEWGGSTSCRRNLTN